MRHYERRIILVMVRNFYFWGVGDSLAIVSHAARDSH
jgi:hypothetical protein